MAAQAQQKKKTSKKPRTRRTPKWEPMNRRGGGRPQKRRITSEAKIIKLQSRMLAHQLEYLGITSVNDNPRTVKILLWLNGQTDQDPDVFNLPREVQEAFVYSVMLTEDARYAVAPNEEPAVRGVGEYFFRHFHVDKKMVDAVASKRHAMAEERARKIEPGYAALGVQNTSMARALVDAGIAPKPVAPKRAPTAEAKAKTAKVAKATVNA